MALETTPQAKTTSRVSRSERPKPSSSFSLRRRLTPYLFILPFGVLFLLFFIVPIIYAVYQSLFRSERSGLGLGAATVNFNGLGNYGDVFHDPTSTPESVACCSMASCKSRSCSAYPCSSPC